MQRKKKSKGAPASKGGVLGREQPALLADLLQQFRTLPPETVASRILSPDAAQVLAESLPLDDPATPAVLVHLGAAFDDRRIRKAIRKAVFKMKQKGIPVSPDLERKPGEPILKRPTEVLDPLAFLGPIDRLGGRGVLVALPNQALGYDAGFGAVGDTEGFVFFKAGSYSRKHMRELQSAFLDAFGGDQIRPVSLSHALAVLERAYGLGKDASSPHLRAYLNLRPRLMERADPLHSPAIYQHIPPSEIPEEALTPPQLERLMMHPLLASWVFDLEKLAPLVSEIKAVETSPIFLTEHQKLARIEEIEEKWIRDSFGASERRILKTRLEETAYLLFHGNEKELSRLCLTTARSLDEGGSAFTIKAFLKFLLDRSLEVYQALEDRPDREEAGETQSNSPLTLP